MRKNKILVLSHMYPNNMAPNYGLFIHNQNKHLAEAGCEIRVISPVPYAPKFLGFKKKWRDYRKIPLIDKIGNITVNYPRYIALPGAWYHSIACYSMYLGIRQCVDSYIRKYNPQVIHAHTATYDGYVGLIFKKRYNLPLVCSFRGSDINVYPFYDRFTMYLTRKLISEADLLVSVSDELKKAAIAIEKPKREMHVVYNGCDLQKFSLDLQHRQAYRQRMHIDKEERVLIFVGELKKNKGIFELLNVFSEIVHMYRKAHLFVIGDGPEYSYVKNYIFANNLGEKVHLLGSQPHNEISKWLSAADIFVLPTHYEGLPNAVLEAMACGLPVVATRVGGIPEIITSGENGILIDANKMDSLMDAIEVLLRNEKLAKKMGNAGRRKMEKQFTWQRNAEEMINIYNGFNYASN